MAIEPVGEGCEAEEAQYQIEFFVDGAKFWLGTDLISSGEQLQDIARELSFALMVQAKFWGLPVLQSTGNTPIEICTRYVANLIDCANCTGKEALALSEHYLKYVAKRDLKLGTQYAATRRAAIKEKRIRLLVDLHIRERKEAAAEEAENLAAAKAAESEVVKKKSRNPGFVPFRLGTGTWFPPTMSIHLREKLRKSVEDSKSSPSYAGPIPVVAEATGEPPDFKPGIPPLEDDPYFKNTEHTSVCHCDTVSPWDRYFPEDTPCGGKTPQVQAFGVEPQALCHCCGPGVTQSMVDDL